MRDTGKFKERYDFSLDSRQLGVVMFAGLAVAALVFVLGMSVGRQWERKHAAVRPAQATENRPAVPESLVPVAPGVEPGAAATPPPADAAADKAQSDVADHAGSGEGIPPKDLTFPKVLTSESGKPEPLSGKKPGKKPDKKPDGSRDVTASKSGGYTVQVGAYTDEATAKKTASALSRKGYNARVRTIAAKGGKKLYKVFVGRYETKDEATAAARKIESSEKLKPYVTSF